MVKIEEQKTLGPGICLWPFCLPWHKSAILLILYLLKILSSFEMSIVKIKEKITICEPGFGLWPIWTLAASCPQSPVKDTGEMNSRRPTCYVSLDVQKIPAVCHLLAMQKNTWHVSLLLHFVAKFAWLHFTFLKLKH